MNKKEFIELTQSLVEQGLVDTELPNKIGLTMKGKEQVKLFYKQNPQMTALLFIDAAGFMENKK